MKRVKRILALVLAMIMSFALGMTAFADNAATNSEYKITVQNSNSAITIVGNTYKAYKIFDATYEVGQDGQVTTDENGKALVAYTVADEFADFTYTVGEGEDAKSYSGDELVKYLETLTSNSEALNTFAQAAMEYANTNNVAAAGEVEATNQNVAKAGDTESVTIDLTEPGYYLVAGSAKSTDGDSDIVVAACSLDTAKPDATVTVKADVPSVDKKIVEGNTDKAANTASIGDTVNFKITSKVPNMQGYEKYFFVLNDTLSKGLTFNDDLIVKVGNTTLENGIGYDLETETDADTGKTTVTVIFKNFIQYRDANGMGTGTDITVTYSATVNQDANLSATEGNPNEVTLTYSNNPNVTGKGTPGDGTPDNPGNPDKPGNEDHENGITGETPKAETKTYVTGLQLTKVDGADTTKKLTGAKFSINGTAQKVVLTNSEMFKESESGTYYMLKDGTYTESVPVTDKSNANYNADKYDSTETKYEKVTVVDKDTVATDIKSEGYVNENGVLTFKGLNAGTYTITELVAPDGYNLLKTPITIIISADATADTCEWTVMNGEIKLSVGTDENSADLYTFNVENNSGTELPSTGGMGTTIFYVLGTILVAGAGILLVTKKRMNKTEG